MIYGCSSTIDPSPKWQLTGAGCASMGRCRGMGKDLNIAESDTGHVSTMLFCGVTKFNQMLTFAGPKYFLQDVLLADKQRALLLFSKNFEFEKARSSEQRPQVLLNDTLHPE